MKMMSLLVQAGIRKKFNGYYAELIKFLYKGGEQMSKWTDIEDKFLDKIADMEPEDENCKKAISSLGSFLSIKDKHDDASFSRDAKAAELDLEFERNQTEVVKVENNAKNAKKDRMNKILTTLIGAAATIGGIFVAANLSEENVFSREAWSQVPKIKN